MPSKQKRMPVLFVGHGSPMNGVEDNDFSRAWAQVAQDLPRPKAILSISAHWETEGTKVTAMAHPKTIHDFYGFPPELYAMGYPAPGSLELANDVSKLVGAKKDQDWGLDHGTWIVLARMFPKADVPVVQLSLDADLGPEGHFKLGQKLKSLRDQGILILGSGNIVHNLMRMDPKGDAYDWAKGFDTVVEDRILKGQFEDLVHYERFDEQSRLSIPTNEHYLPMLYALSLMEKGEPLKFFAEGMVLGSISMRSIRIG
jgi:4,5-DOPA dioxygenase extradiol